MAGLQHRRQQLLQVLGVGAGEDAGHGVLHAAQAHFGQRLTHQLALRVGAHQHRHVSCGQGPVGVLNLAVNLTMSLTMSLTILRGVQEPGHLGSAGLGGPHFGLCFEQWRAVGVARQGPQLQGAAGRAGVHPGRALLGAVVHRVVVQALQHEGLRVGCKAGVQRGQQRCAGTLVVQQRVGGCGLAARAQVGLQVGMAEAVNGLFGVAHQEQRRGARRVAINPLEDRKLQRVGVLKLVDQSRRKARQQRRCHGVGCGRIVGVKQALVQVQQQVVIAVDPGLALDLLQRRGPVVEQLFQ